MAPILYPPSLLSADQVLQHAYDDPTQTLRTTATAVIIGQPIEVEIDMATDSIKLGDGTTLFTSTTVGPKTGLDVNLINPSLLISNFPSTVDTNYGVVGVNTIRTASQIGNATGAANFNAGLTTAQTLRVVLPTDQTAIPATQSGVWTTGRTWTLNSATDSVTITGTITTSPDVNIHDSAGNVLTSLAGSLNVNLTNSSIAVTQSTSPWVISGTISVSNLPTTVDTNYGIVGANTIRTASQIGNSTGAASFNSGVTTAQTLRVVLPTDQSSIPVTQSGTWTTGRTWTLNSGTDSVTVTGSVTTSPNVNIHDSSGNSLTSVAGSLNVNLTNASISVTQGTSPWVISGTISASNFPATVDTNYGVVGANTLRSAAQIGNATGAALFGAGTTTAQVLRVVLPTDQTSIPVAQSGAWSVSATQGTSPWITSVTNLPTTVDTNYGVVGTSTIRTAAQIGNATGAAAFNAGVTTAQVLRVVLPTDQTSIPVAQSGIWTVIANQGTSPWVVSGTITAAEDKNYGTVGANTLRTASQIGNATGAADFNAGTTSAQTLRVVLPTNQTSIPVTQSTSPWVTSVNNFPTTVDTNYGTVGASTIRTASEIGNATGAAAFNAGTTTAQVLRVVLPTDQTAIPISDNAGDYSSTATLTQVNRSNASTTLKAANSSRRGLVLYNNTGAVCYVSFAATSSTTAFTLAINNNETVSLDKTPIYTGIITGIWGSNGAGQMMVTELT